MSSGRLTKTTTVTLEVTTEAGITITTVPVDTILKDNGDLHLDPVVVPGEGKVGILDHVHGLVTRPEDTDLVHVTGAGEGQDLAHIIATDIGQGHAPGTELDQVGGLVQNLHRGNPETVLDHILLESLVGDLCQNHNPHKKPQGVHKYRRGMIQFCLAICVPGPVPLDLDRVLHPMLEKT